jgi:hypothetical protein
MRFRNYLQVFLHFRFRASQGGRARPRGPGDEDETLGYTEPEVQDNNPYYFAQRAMYYSSGTLVPSLHTQL